MYFPLCFFFLSSTLPPLPQARIFDYLRPVLPSDVTFFLSFRLVMLVALVPINWLVYALVGGLAEAGEQLRGDCKSWALSKST